MIHYDKLVRDKIPAIIEAAGKTAVTDSCSEVNHFSFLSIILNQQ